MNFKKINLILMSVLLMVFLVSTSNTVLGGLGGGGGSGAKPKGDVLSVTVSDQDQDTNQDITEGEGITITMKIKNIGSAAGTIIVKPYLTGPGMTDLFLGLHASAYLNVNDWTYVNVLVPYEFTAGGSTRQLNEGNYWVSKIQIYDYTFRYEYPNLPFTIYPGIPVIEFVKVVSINGLDPATEPSIEKGEPINIELEFKNVGSMGGNFDFHLKIKNQDYSKWDQGIWFKFDNFGQSYSISAFDNSEIFNIDLYSQDGRGGARYQSGPLEYLVQFPKSQYEILTIHIDNLQGYDPPDDYLTSNPKFHIIDPFPSNFVNVLMIYSNEWVDEVGFSLPDMGTFPSDALSHPLKSGYRGFYEREFPIGYHQNGFSEYMNTIFNVKEVESSLTFNSTNMSQLLYEIDTIANDVIGTTWGNKLGNLGWDLLIGLHARTNQGNGGLTHLSGNKFVLSAGFEMSEDVWHAFFLHELIHTYGGPHIYDPDDPADPNDGFCPPEQQYYCLGTPGEVWPPFIMHGEGEYQDNYLWIYRDPNYPIYGDTHTILMNNKTKFN
ncbi:MAG: hypothetical protein ACW967_00465 [Candidatus Hodarchaeales archaeon]